MALSQSPAFLGYGLIRPLQRDQKNDFANAGAVQLIKSCVGQILGTRAANENGTIQGEIWWRPDFGSRLYLLKHRKGPNLSALAEHYTRDALQKWEPRVRVKSVSASFDPTTRILSISLRYDIVSANTASNNVIASGVTQTVAIPMAA